MEATPFPLSLPGCTFYFIELVDMECWLYGVRMEKTYLLHSVLTSTKCTINSPQDRFVIYVNSNISSLCQMCWIRIYVTGASVINTM